MNTLYLHIGTHKTGSTAIQQFCVDNAQLFMERGYCYPDFNLRYRYKGKSRNGLFLGMPYFDNTGSRRPDLEENNFNTASQKIHELFETYHNIVLSDEALWINLYKNDARVLRKLIEDSRNNNYRIRTIIYLRRQDQLVESMWAQRIRSRSNTTTSLPEYISKYPYLDYHGMLSLYAGLIGPENISVRRYDDAKSREGGIIRDFLQQIGLELSDEFRNTDIWLNTSLYGNVVEIKRIINGLTNFTHDDVRLFNESLRMSSETAKNNYQCSLLSAEERMSLMRKYEEGNNVIASELIADGRPLFSADYSGPGKLEDDNPEYVRDIIRSSAATDVILYRRLIAAEAELKKLKITEDNMQNQINRLRHPVKTLLHKISKTVRAYFFLI